MKTHSDYVRAGVLLPRRARYSMRDVNNLITDSLFTGPRTLSVSEAAQIVFQSAVAHDADFSLALYNARNEE